MSGSSLTAAVVRQEQESSSDQPPGNPQVNPITGKRKRDKYAGKACAPCKSRKIKCGGGIPCAPCVRRKRPCLDTDEPEGAQEDDLDTLSHNGGNRAESRALRNRLATLESHLNNLTQALMPMIASTTGPQLIAGQSPDQRVLCSSNSDNHTQGTDNGRHSATGMDRSPKEHLSFATSKNPNATRNLGETSVTNALQRVEDRLNEIGLPVAEGESAPATPPMTPMPTKAHDWKTDSPRDRIARALESNGIEPNHKQMDEYLETFKAEVYPLYPFLTEEIISDTYDELWDSLSLFQINNSEKDVQLDHVVQALLILAIGRCTVSIRSHKSDGLHSAGWSLYSMAMDLQGCLLDTVNDDSKPLSSLHTLCLVVIYLIRLDANERAQKVLSLAVVHAHHLGIHLSQTLDDMPPLETELFKRVWWCMYVLDRRVALVLGRPFLIQDANISIGPPKDLDVSSPDSMKGSAFDFYHLDSEPPEPSPIHYLFVMVGYSKLVGKVWEALFSAEPSTQSAKLRLHEYLDTLVNNWMDSIPKFLACDHEDVHQSTPIRGTSTQFKQRFLIRLRYLYILIIIRSPTKRPQQTSIWSNNIQSETLCLQHAASIISMFQQCTPADGIYGFPFLPYLLEATITMLACISRLPSLKPSYLDTAERALRMLNQFCKKTWVSGKTARIIYKLGDIIPRVFASHPTPRSLSQGIVNIETGVLPHSHTEQQNESANVTVQESHLANPDHRSRAWRMYEPSQKRFQRTTIDPSTPKNSSNPSNESSTFTSMPENAQKTSAAFFGPESDGGIMNAELQSSMIADFPFEINFGPANLQGMVGNNGTRDLVNGKSGREDFSTDFLGMNDLEWLNEVIGQSTDHRLMGFE